MRSSFTVFALAAAFILLGANSFVTNAQTTRGTLNDFTGTGKTSFVTISGYSSTPTNTPVTWKILGNPANPAPNQAFIRRFNYGLGGDLPVPRDYVGDSKSEIAVWRAGTYYLAQTPTGTGGVTLDRAVQWGASDDIAGCEGDYDGDGKIDYTVARFNSATGALTYYYMSSSTNTMRAVPFGLPATAAQFAPVAGANFAGDNKDELVLLTIASNGIETYYVGDAVNGTGILTRTFGNFNTDFAITPADYTGDGKADFVAVRENANGTPATWYINNSVTNVNTATAFGISDPNFNSNDTPVRGDYDGDGRQDIAVWRDSNQTFYWISSANGSIQAQKSGDSGDIPLGGFGEF